MLLWVGQNHRRQQDRAKFPQSKVSQVFLKNKNKNNNIQLKYQYKHYDKQYRNEDDVINQSEAMCSKAGSIVILASKPGK